MLPLTQRILVYRNNTEFRELIYYGNSTLCYCFERFRHRGQTGLEGKIMALVCEELLHGSDGNPVNVADASMVQLWYDTLLAHSSNLEEPILRTTPVYP